MERLEELESKPDIGAYKRAEQKAERVAQQAANKKRLMKDTKFVIQDDGTVYEDSESSQEEENLLSPDDSMLILTGANASGKSVFLKTVALIVYIVRGGTPTPMPSGSDEIIFPT